MKTKDELIRSIEICLDNKADCNDCVYQKSIENHKNCDVERLHDILEYMKKTNEPVQEEAVADDVDAFIAYRSINDVLVNGTREEIMMMMVAGVEKLVDDGADRYAVLTALTALTDVLSEVKHDEGTVQDD